MIRNVDLRLPSSIAFNQSPSDIFACLIAFGMMDTESGRINAADMVNCDVPDYEENRTDNNSPLPLTEVDFKDLPSSWKPELKSSRVLAVFSVAFTLLGLLTIVTEICTLLINVISTSYGTGLWMGAILLLDSMVNTLLIFKRSNRLTIACLIVSSIGLCSCFMGATLGYYGAVWVIWIRNAIFLDKREEQFVVLAASVLAGCFYIAHLTILCFALCKRRQ